MPYSFSTNTRFGAEYDLEHLNELPAGWKDISWGNDMCPSFEVHTFHEEAFVCLWVDARLPEDREEESMHRFCVQIRDYDNIVIGDDYKEFYTGDDWAEANKSIREAITFGNKAKEERSNKEEIGACVVCSNEIDRNSAWQSVDKIQSPHYAVITNFGKVCYACFGNLTDDELLELGYKIS